MKPVKRLSYIIILTFVAWCFTPTVHAVVSAFDVPELYYPRYGEETRADNYPPLGVPTFSWSPVIGASSYRLQVSNNLDFSPEPDLNVTTHNTFFTPRIIFADGVWYWRVRVEGPLPAGEWSVTSRFEKAWAAANNKPELLAPLEGEAMAFFDSPAFSWTPVLGAARYRFQISASRDDFATPVFSAEILATTIQPDLRLVNQSYYWRVIPMDAADHLGYSSNVRGFINSYGTTEMNMVPALLEPQDETEAVFAPTFQWTAIKGAEQYRLEYTSNQQCDFSSSTVIETHHPIYTPVEPLSNGTRYCWRVRAEAGDAAGDWSPAWHFIRNWDLKPTNLTPTDFYSYTLYPVYSWTPVPGAGSYLVEISTDPNIEAIFEQAVTSNTSFTAHVTYDVNTRYFWRVTPIDGGGNYGASSDISQFNSASYSIAPIQIYPLYYYEPHQNAQFPMNPSEDRTVALPIFIWHRMINVFEGGQRANAYRIQVADTPNFNNILWQYDTENTSATPTEADDFSPSSGQIYYWRVCALDYIDGKCQLVQNAEEWSQVWAARFDPAFGLQPTSGDKPALLRPKIGQVSVDATPMLEWWPLAGASRYQVEVSQEKDFSTDVLSMTVNIPAYSPKYALAQRNLDEIHFGTFYWRVRGLKSEGWSSWSDVWRFQIAAQSEWRSIRVPGALLNRMLIAVDPSEPALPAYSDLISLYAAQSSTEWFFGFDIDLSQFTTTYMVYLDLDNVDGSGALSPPPGRNYQVTTVPEHQPEYALCIDVIDGVVNPANTWLYSWNGKSWDSGQSFSGISANAQDVNGYVELEIPGTVIGLNETSSSTSIVLFSVDPTTGLLQDAVPSSHSGPGYTVLSHFSAVSEELNLVYPPTNSSSDPTAYSSVLPFYWDWPTGTKEASPFAGIKLQVDTDPNYLAPHEVDIQTSTNTTYFSQNSFVPLNDIAGDGLYYWRIRPWYMAEGFPPGDGSWTGGWSFRRTGFKPKNPSTSFSYATVTFSWDMAEGASMYRLQVTRDPDFVEPIIDITTPVTSYTPVSALLQGTYYWRVKIIRYGAIENDWSEVQQFEITMSAPTGLSPDNHLRIQTTPTFCWNPLEGYSGDILSMTAWRYHLQVSNDPEFYTITDSGDTYNNCWTPTRGYMDGTYFWRVAVSYGKDQTGPYSLVATFIKQSGVTSLISPLFGSPTDTPRYIWNPMSGAAEYIIEISRYANFSTIFDAQVTPNLQYATPIRYPHDRIYYWRVAVRDYDGNLGRYSKPAMFAIGFGYKIYIPQIQR